MTEFGGKIIIKYSTVVDEDVYCLLLNWEGA